MNKFEVIRETAAAIDDALASASSCSVESDDGKFAYGVVMGVTMVTDYIKKQLTVTEVFDDMAQRDSEWIEKADFVKGALAGALAISKLVAGAEDV